ncbi:MAG: PP2C family protein-serine/threonine phosphatase [Aquabacterium sp.]
MQIELAILSKRGGRSYNEDACGHWHSDTHLCCVVADGAGGHGGGDKASRLAVGAVIEGFAAQPDLSGPSIEQLIRATNQNILSHRGDDPSMAQMHSTVVSLFIDLDGNVAAWGHAGDSRLYAFRGGRIQTQTKDHSVVQGLVDSGLLQGDQMRTHAQRSELVSALGLDDSDLLIDANGEPWAMRPGDVFLLCTDGLWEYVEEPALEAALQAATDPHGWLDTLEQAVLRNAANKPSHDNFSALTVWVTEDPPA